MMGTLFLSAIFAAGCDREGVHAYSIPKEKRAPEKMADGAAAPGDMSGPLPKSTVPPAQQSTIGPRLTKFVPPEQWKADASSSGIVAAAFNATNARGGARITATSLFNDGGGPLANINRWRGQLELGPVESLEAQPKTALGPNSVMVDLQDAAGARRMITAIVPDGTGGQTWFFKITGAPKGVEAERAAFERFVRSIGLGEP